MNYREEYDRYITPYIEGKPRIEIDSETIARIDALVNQLIKWKSGEAHHQNDNKKEHTRFYTGFLGEAAMEKYFNISIIDWSVGESSYYNEADLRKAGYNIGIKTVEHGKFPIVHKNVERPELINIKLDSKTVVFMGYAAKDVLKKYQNDNFILSPELKARNTKSAFYGIPELLQIRNFNDLNRIFCLQNHLIT